jgi:hypothetical protein
MINHLRHAAALCVLVAPAAFAVDGTTLINQAVITSSGGFPYTISSPGSYKLSGNLVAGTHGLIIAADNVTLNFNGFTITGPGNSSSTGIQINGTRSGVAIRNGVMKSWQEGITVGTYCASCTFEDLRLSDVRSGLLVIAGSGVLVDHVVVGGADPALGFCILSNAGASIISAATVAGCSGGIKVSTGASVKGNNISETAQGIQAGDGALVSENVLTGSFFSGALSVGAGSTVNDNIIRSNGAALYGISASCPSRIVGNTVTGTNADISVGAGCLRSSNSPSP